MPYYLHSKTVEPEWGTPYETVQEARENLNNIGAELFKVSFVASDNDRIVWRMRESDRFESGKYVRVPWAGPDRYPDHYVHLSTVHAGLVAYTKTEEHGVSDRQTRIRPGKYLEEFYSDIAGDCRDRWIQECSAQHMQLSIARTPVDIVRVYRGGPTSCMDGRKTFDCGSDHHPAEVYGNSDLGVAYVGNMDKATARAIIWPDKMLFTSRIYGNEHLLRTLLETAGYSQGSMRGAKIRRVMCDDGYVMPYVDGIGSAHEDGRWIVLGSGPLDCQITNGVTSEEEDNTRACDHCGDSYEENDDTDPYCQSCYDDSYNCIDCNETYFADGNSTDNGMLCESCYSDRLKTCEVCDRQWLEEEEFSRTQRRDRQNDGTSDLCRRCADHHAYCCDGWYDTNDHSACPQCEPEEEDDSDTDDSDDTPDTPADVPIVRYMRNSRIEFHGEAAYLMLDATGTLWTIEKDGTTSRRTDNWVREWEGFVSSGRWEYFTPFPAQDLLRPVLAHAVPPYATPDTTPATIESGAL